MKKILVPTDFSKTANNAKEYAIQLALSFNAEIILLNAFQVPYTGAGTGSLVNIDKIALDNSEREMKANMDMLENTYSDIKFSSFCTDGFIVDSIKTYSEKNNIDLIVMGTVGTSGFVGNLLGSNTSALIGSTQTPVIVVPGNAKAQRPQQIIVATDLTHSGDEKLFDVLRKIGMNYKAEIEFLFIGEDDDKVSNKINKLKAANFDEKFDAKYRKFHFKESDDIEDEILDYIEDNDVDLLTVISQKRGFLEDIFHQSVSKSLVKKADLPILVLPE